MNRILLIIAYIWFALSICAQNPGHVIVTAPVGTPATNSTFGAQEPRYGYGGMVTGGALSQFQDLNWYPLARRHPYQFFCDTNNGILYQLQTDLTTLTVYNPSTSTGIVPTISTLLNSTSLTNLTSVEVLGYYYPGDRGGGRYILTNVVTLTNSYGGRFVSALSGNSWQLVNNYNSINALQFGVIPNDPVQDYINNSAVQAMMSFVAGTTTPGAGLVVEFPPGNTYVTGPISAPSVTRITGVNSGGPQLQSALIITTANTSLLTSLSDNVQIEHMYFGGASPFLADQCTSGYLVSYTSGAYESTVFNCQFADWFGGINIPNSFDFHLTDSSMTSVAQPLLLGGAGSHNALTRVAFRGERRAYSDSTTQITGSYVANTLTLTVSDSSTFAVNDYVRPLVAAGIANTISSEMFWRQVLAKPTSTTLTLNRPWALGSTNITIVTKAIGNGQTAIDTGAEQSFDTINFEWGAWRRLIYAQRGTPAGVTVKDCHIEGLVWYYPSVDVAMFDGVNATFVFPGYLHIVNSVIGTNINSISLMGQTSGAIGQYYAQRNIESDPVPAKPIWAQAVAAATYPWATRFNDVQVFGGTFRPDASTVPIMRNRRTTFSNGNEGHYQEAVGLTNLVRYFESGLPATGAWLVGDVAHTPVGDYFCNSSGIFGSPSGNIKIRLGSQVLVPDSTFRGVNYLYYPVAIGGTNYLIDWITRQPLTTFTISADANIGDRWVYVSSTPSNVAAGDWASIDFSSADHEDFRIERVTSQAIYLTEPLAAFHASGTTVEIGFHINYSSQVDIPTLTAAYNLTPSFRSYGGVSSSSGRLEFGSTVTGFGIGSDAGGTGLTVYGGSGGVPNIILSRSGQDPIGLLASSGLSISDRTLLEGLLHLRMNGVNTNLMDMYGGFLSGSDTPNTFAIRPQEPAGTNIVGPDLRLYGGNGTGSAASGKVEVYIATPGSSGATVQTPTVAASFERSTTPVTGDTTFHPRYWNGSGYADSTYKVPFSTLGTALGYASISAASSGTGTISVLGADVNNFVLVNPRSQITSGLTYYAYISATNTVTVVVVNGTAGALGTTNTWDAIVFKP